MKYTFVPPRLSSTVLRFVFRVYPQALRLKEGVTKLTVSEEDWKHLAGLKGKPAILLCNHPSWAEPQILFGLSRKLNEPFFYVASYDLFVMIPWLGWIINRLGAFSIQQGGSDRESLKMCQDILINRRAKLAILPEGEPNFCNERIQRFNPGAIQIGIWSAEKMVKRAEEQGNTSVELPIVPIVIKYRHVGDPRPELTRTLLEIESALGVVAEAGKSLIERTCKVSLLVLERIENEYNIVPKQEQSVDDRILRLYDFVEQRVLAITNAHPPKETERHTRMRALFNLLYDFRDELMDGKTEDEKRRHEHHQKIFEGVFVDMRRYENFMTISGDFLEDDPSTERLSEMLFRLSKEVLGKEMRFPLREAFIKIGEPTDIVAHYDRYKQAKRETLNGLTSQLENQMRSMLESMGNLRTPL